MATPCELESMAGWVDALGYPCIGWVGYDCFATSGYSSAELEAVRQNCPECCGLESPPPLPPHSPTPPFSPPLPPAPPPLAPPPPTPPLGAGDCMVIGFNSDGRDGFAIVLLAPLLAGQSITATDDGWRTDVIPNGFRARDTHTTAESHMTHTASAEEPAGTVLRHDPTAWLGTVDFVGSISLNAGSDQLIVYRGTMDNPTFLCALDTSGGYTPSRCPGSPGGWHQSFCDTSRTPDLNLRFSALPPGLTEGVNALSWQHRDNFAYAGTTVGTPSELRAAIAQRDSWTSSNTFTQVFIVDPFTVLDPSPSPSAPPSQHKPPIGPPRSPPPPLPPPSPPAPPPLPPLTAGDCMVVAFNTYPTTGFAIVLLAPLGAGQQIVATGDDWRTDVTPNAFRRVWEVSACHAYSDDGRARRNRADERQL